MLQILRQRDINYSLKFDILGFDKYRNSDYTNQSFLFSLLKTD